MKRVGLKKREKQMSDFQLKDARRESGWLSGYQPRLPPLRSGFNHDEVVCGMSFSPAQSEAEGFSLGTPVFLPHQNRLSVNYIQLWTDILDRDNLWYPSLSLY